MASSDPPQNVELESSPSTKAPHSPRPFWQKKKYWALFAALLLIYPVVVSAALWSGLVEKILKSEDLRVEIEKPAYSIIPGDFHLKSVKVYMNGDTQFTLFADDIHARVDIIPLLRRTFSLSWLSAENVKFRMRVQQEKEAAEAPRTLAFPPLDGLPGVNTKSEDEGGKTEEREASWTVHLEDLRVGVSELWFFEYRYLGAGELKGGFERGPSVLRVSTSVQQLGPGKLLYGEKHVISHNFRGHVQAEIPKVNPSEHADLSFFDFVNADIDLKADIVGLEHISDYIPDAEVRKGEGHLTIHGILKKGALSENTTVAFATEEVEFLTDNLAVKTDLDFLIEVAVDAPDAPKKKDDSVGPVPRLRSHSDVTYLTFSSEKMQPFTLQLRGHTEKAALGSTQLDEEMKVVAASVEIPAIVSNDLKDVEALSGGAMQADAGEAAAGLHLSMDDEGRFHGPFHADLKGMELEVTPIKMSLDGRLKFQTSLDLAHKTLMLSGIEADVKDVDFIIGDNRIENWWLSLRGKKFWMDWGHDQMSANASLSSKNAEPVIRAVAHGKGGVPEIAADLLKFPDVRAAAELRREGDTFDLMLEDLETDFVDFSGRVFRQGEKLQLALLVGGKALSLGLYKDEQNTDIRPMARAGWLNKKLELFPAPREKVAAPKP